MALTTRILRDLLFSLPVKDPLIDRETEMPILPEEKVNILDNPTEKKVFEFMTEYFNQMTPQADEVFPSLFIGNYKSIMDVSYLLAKGITHVLNVGEHDPLQILPNISPDQMKDSGISYHTKFISDYVKGSDKEVQMKVFKEAAQMVEDILAKPDSRLVVNCMAGLSRSASVVITYLMVKKDMTASEAITLIKKNRDVWPSNPNLKFLAEINNQIHGFVGTQDDEDFGDIPLRTLVNVNK